MYVTNNGLNEASFRHRLDLISKNIIKNQNPIKLLFKDVKHFDAQNSLIGSLIREVDIGKKKGLSKFFDKAPDIRDLSLGLDLINFAMERNFLIGETTTTTTTIIIIIIIIMMEIFFCRLIHLRLILIFQTKQGSDHFQKLEVFKMIILTIFNFTLIL